MRSGPLWSVGSPWKFLKLALIFAPWKMCSFQFTVRTHFSNLFFLFFLFLICNHLKLWIFVHLPFFDVFRFFVILFRFSLLLLSLFLVSISLSFLDLHFLFIISSFYQHFAQIFLKLNYFSFSTSSHYSTCTTPHHFLFPPTILHALIHTLFYFLPLFYMH